MKRTVIASVLLLAALGLSGCSAMTSSESFSLPAEVQQDGGSAAYDESTQSFADTTQADREQMITGYLTVTVDQPADAAKDAIRIVEGASGRVDGRQEYAPANGDKGSSTLTLRIPADSLDATIEKLGELGTVIEISTTADDVTLTLSSGLTVVWGSSEDSPMKSEVLTKTLLSNPEASTIDVTSPHAVVVG